MVASAPQSVPVESPEVVVEVEDVVTRYGMKVVHDGISLSVERGEIFAIVGGSGSGKTTLMREILMLQRPTSGKIRVLGIDVGELTDVKAIPLRRRMGVMFQFGALFGDMTVLENIGMPLREHTGLSSELIDQTALLKLELVGLERDVAALFPSQLSGGMRKRVAVARALALDPELLFLDEPSSGLDPISADELDDLILQLQALLGLTIVVVTHDMDSLWRVSDRVALLADAKLHGMGSMEELAGSADPVVRQFFQGPRGRASSQAALQAE